MGVYKDAKRGTWFVELRYKNAYGEPKKKKREVLKNSRMQKNGKLNF